MGVFSRRISRREPPSQPLVQSFSRRGWDATADAILPGRVPLETVAEALGQRGPMPTLESPPKLIRNSWWPCEVIVKVPEEDDGSYGYWEIHPSRHCSEFKPELFSSSSSPIHGPGELPCRANTRSN